MALQSRIPTKRQRESNPRSAATFYNCKQHFAFYPHIDNSFVTFWTNLERILPSYDRQGGI